MSFGNRSGGTLTSVTKCRVSLLRYVVLGRILPRGKAWLAFVKTFLSFFVLGFVFLEGLLICFHLESQNKASSATGMGSSLHQWLRKGK